MIDSRPTEASTGQLLTEEMFTALWEKHHGFLYYVAFGFCGGAHDFASDVLEQAFASVFVSDTYIHMSEPEFFAWMIQSMKWAVMNDARASNVHTATVDRLPDVIQDNTTSWIPRPDETYEQKWTRTQISKALNQLPDEQRDAICLKYSGHSVEQIAELMGVSRDCTRSRLFRGNKLLRSLLTALGLGPGQR